MPQPPHDNFKVEINQRLDKLENIVLQSLQKTERPCVKHCGLHLSDIDTDDSYLSDDSEDSCRRKWCKTKSKFDQKRFSPESEPITSFEMLMLTTANAMMYMLDCDMDISSLVHHFKFLAAKAVAAQYKPEAFVNYDSAVRQ